jgi:hypothetical protein
MNPARSWPRLSAALVATAFANLAWAADQPSADDFPKSGFSWVSSAPLVAPEPPCIALKDPTFVQFRDRGHLFATAKDPDQTRMSALSFTSWTDADNAPRTRINLVDAYHCAPQVFYFRPHEKWYLIYQWTDPRTDVFGPGFSTLDDPGRPSTLTPPRFLYDEKPPNIDGWLDFWVICDDSRAYLFFTSLDGRMWRAHAPLSRFPHGWSEPIVALQADIFEASHTYKLAGRKEYLTIVEAQHPGQRRYYKAYLADRLDGQWRPLADSWELPFAGQTNVSFAPGVDAWTDSISHGELVRAGIDETMTVDPKDLRFIFQGCTSNDRRGKGYGAFPWRIGMLELRR